MRNKTIIVGKGGILKNVTIPNGVDVLFEGGHVQCENVKVERGVKLRGK